MDAVLLEDAHVSTEIENGFVGKCIMTDLDRRELGRGMIRCEKKSGGENKRKNSFSHGSASVFLIPDILQKPVSGDLLSQAAAFGFAHDIAGGGGELQALGAAVGEEGHLVFIGAAFEFAGHNVSEQREVSGENVDLGIGDSFNFLRVAGDHRAFSAYSPLA